MNDSLTNQFIRKYQSPKLSVNNTVNEIEFGELNLETLESLRVIRDKETEKNTNNKCFECNSNDPKWVSINNGIFICINCAGAHRNLGVHLSRVKSL